MTHRQRITKAANDIKSFWQTSKMERGDKNLLLALCYERLWYIYAISGINKGGKNVTDYVEMCKVRFGIKGGKYEKK
ncbi:MAG: hypothetical protein LBC64_07595 [Fibromonadaceae bacterium]|jgi:hypothetical protein|nr:hypothetical protein [Fibromonadaceae bacterium]